MWITGHQTYIRYGDMFCVDGLLLSLETLVTSQGFGRFRQMPSGCMKVQGTANCAAARTFYPRAVSTHEFSLARVEDNVFLPEKSICYHSDAALPCQISLPVFYGWFYWTIVLIPMMASCSF